MKNRLLKLCSIILIISMVLGNVGSLAVDATESTNPSTGMTFSEYRKGVIENPFATNVKTLEAEISLATPEELTEMGTNNYKGIILGMRGASSLPELHFGIFSTSDKQALPWIRYHGASGETVKELIFNYNLISKVGTDKKIHLAFVMNEVNGATNIICYVDGTAVTELASGYSQPTVSFNSPKVAYCVGGDYATNQSDRYFKGEIYSITTYSDVRNATEIVADKDEVDTTEENLLAYYDLTNVTDATTKVNNESTSDANQQYALNIVETWMTERKPALSNWDKENGDFSIALVGDTQIATEYDVKNGYTDGTGVVSGIYDWLLQNKDEKNIQFVMGLGDIVQGESKYALNQGTSQVDVEKTDAVQEAEWEYAMSQIQTLNGKIPYSLIRGNHDNQLKYMNHVKYTDYKDVVEGSLDETMLNTWQELVVNDIEYLILSLDLGASDTELAWAEEVIKTHPNHNVIITTHAYLDDDGSRLPSNHTYAPNKYYSNMYPESAENPRNSGEMMWEKTFKKYDNIVMIISGHIGTDNVIMNKDTGVNGNTVVQMLVDPQSLDHTLAKSTTGERNKPTGMICMLNFSADGKTVQVEQISTAYKDETTGKNEYYMNTSQFTFEMNVIKDAKQKLLLNTQQMERSDKWPFARKNSDYACATYTAQMILSSGYTNVISYCAPSDGFVRIVDMKVGFYSSAQSGGLDSNGNAREFEFAVTDEQGRILTNHGEVLLFNPDRTLVENMSIEEMEIEKGESIYFVIHGNKGATNLVQCTPNIEFRENADEDWEGVSSLNKIVPWPKDAAWTDVTAVQGMGNFYYHYSESYEKKSCDEANKKLFLNTKLMATVGSNKISDASTSCWTCVPQIIVTAGGTNVISYQVAKDGYIWIDKMHVWKVNDGSSYDVDFAVVNEHGDILTNNGDIYNLRESYYNQIATALSKTPNIVMPKQKVKKGESIYFVFHGNSGTTSVRCVADIQFCATGEITGTTVGYGYDMINGFSLRNSGVTNANFSQGTKEGDFFYGYSNAYEVVDDTEAQYLHINSKVMDKYRKNGSGTVDFPFAFNTSHCMTSYNQIIVSPGYTNVIAYEASSDGTLCIDEMKTWIINAGVGRSSSFAVVDDSGKILSNNGEIYIVNSYDSDTNAKNAAKNLVVEKIKMTKGERIYFVFHGLDGANTTALRCNAKILFDKEGDGTFAPIQTAWHHSDMTLYSTENAKTYTYTENFNVADLQGKGGFYYLYLDANTTYKSGVEIGDETEGVVTVYEPLASKNYYCDKYLIDTEMETVGSVTKAKNYIDLDMLNIKKQSKVNTEVSDRIDVRYIASVDNLNYNSVGFVFSNKADNQAPTIETVGEKANKPTNTVYARVLEGEGSRKAENIYAEDGCNSMYGFAFEIRKTPANSTVYARAYVELKDGTIVYGSPRAVTTTTTGTVD